MSAPKLRYASYSELPEIAHVMALAFFDDNLFGDIVHPHRNQFPNDVDLYWLRRARVNFWDYRWRWVVAVDRDKNGKEVIVGIAQWERLGDGGKKMECWWFDPRNLLKPLSCTAMGLHTLIWPNRASDPIDEDIVERAYPCFGDVWSGERAESWYLEYLALHPDFQGKGLGRMLVKWGLDRAEEEGICASVASTRGKDRFYQKVGFEEQYGNAGEGEGNPLAKVETGNMFWKMPKLSGQMTVGTAQTATDNSSQVPKGSTGA
ncbi:acyl-CoA N-acyltransferase [Pseudomassariella vexata]|uniref:Acyl-CoA N-acyltransferase n=1 Tax=Pseudomassariella vexata TaxID=1141098 RepID=A0A1Y2DL31_9PEZI|nr:acyl-CoA N-acyltransferase [Pseudomassariella vexata]ORY59963.1 acyl-CoA N-acyltransferase [Pseudomassariella vexata]